MAKEPFDPSQYVGDNHPDVLKRHKAEEKFKASKKREQELIQLLADAEMRWQRVLNIAKPKKPPRIRSKKLKGVRQATPLLLGSDWHLEEEVLPGRVNDLNAFNLQIAKQSAQNCFDGWAWMIKFCRKSQNGERSFSCRKAVLWLGGDMITNYLHEENQETNLLGPMEAIRFAQERIIEGIDHLLEDCKLEHLEVVCNFGNHGRITKRTRAKTAAKNNLEWLMYHSIADVFAKDDRVSFTIPDGVFAYAEVEGHWIRFTHGDTWRYQGGVGGLSIPLLRGLARLEKGAPHDVALTVLGHFHQFSDFGQAIVNGSLIGYNEYSLSCSFPYEDAKQGFVLIDKKRGKCITTPIWVRPS